MKVLITGAKGFIGKNLCAKLQYRSNYQIFEVDRYTPSELFDEYCRSADIVFHLAGVNRPEDPAEFMQGNYGLTETMLNNLKRHGNTCPIVFSSSIHATSDTAYGLSKKACEESLMAYAKKTGAEVFIYRLPNVFGKWSRPNYNSVVATFCYNIGRDLPIHVSDRSIEMNLVYIDDVVAEFLDIIEGNVESHGYFREIPTIYPTTLGNLVDTIYSFKNSRGERSIPDMSNGFIKKLHSTYLSFLPENALRYRLTMNIDNRGSFTEFIRTVDRGQVSVNVSKPGITKGNHWHHTKAEKFLVVSGEGVIRLRRIDSKDVHEYFVRGEELEVVDIPPGYTHNIENLGDTDMVTIMWANESFDPEKPDTFYLEI